MTYQPREGVDAKTREGRRVTCIRKDYPSLFEYPISGRTPNGTLLSYAGDGKYSIGSTHPNDLVSDWEETKEEPTMKYEINHRYECAGLKPDLPEGTMLTVWLDCRAVVGMKISELLIWANVTHFLVESYPKAKGWVNVCRTETNSTYVTCEIFSTKEKADNDAAENRIDCIEIEYNNHP